MTERPDKPPGDWDWRPFRCLGYTALAVIVTTVLWQEPETHHDEVGAVTMMINYLMTLFVFAAMAVGGLVLEALWRKRRRSSAR